MVNSIQTGLSSIPIRPIGALDPSNSLQVPFPPLPASPVVDVLSTQSPPLTPIKHLKKADSLSPLKFLPSSASKRQSLQSQITPSQTPALDTHLDSSHSVIGISYLTIPRPITASTASTTYTASAASTASATPTRTPILNRRYTSKSKYSPGDQRPRTKSRSTTIKRFDDIPLALSTALTGNDFEFQSSPSTPVVDTNLNSSHPVIDNRLAMLESSIIAPTPPAIDFDPDPLTSEHQLPHLIIPGDPDETDIEAEPQLLASFEVFHPRIPRSSIATTTLPGTPLLHTHYTSKSISTDQTKTTRSILKTKFYSKNRDTLITEAFIDIVKYSQDFEALCWTIPAVCRQWRDCAFAILHQFPSVTDFFWLKKKARIHKLDHLEQTITESTRKYRALYIEDEVQHLKDIEMSKSGSKNSEETLDFMPKDHQPTIDNNAWLFSIAQGCKLRDLKKASLAPNEENKKRCVLENIFKIYNFICFRRIEFIQGMINEELNTFTNAINPRVPIDRERVSSSIFSCFSTHSTPRKKRLIFTPFRQALRLQQANEVILIQDLLHPNERRPLKLLELAQKKLENLDKNYEKSHTKWINRPPQKPRELKVRLPLTQFPNIGCLQSIVCLDLSNNKLSSLPSGILQLVLLETLNISNNLFKEIDPKIFRFRNLVRVIFSGNPGANIHLSSKEEWLNGIRRKCVQKEITIVID